MRTNCLAVPSVLAVIALAIAGCGGGNGPGAGANPGNAQAASPSTTAWETYKVSGRPYVETVDLPGASVHGMETTQLMAKVGGYVKEIKHVGDVEIDIGSIVKKGDTLAVLAVPELRDELRQREARIEQAQSAVVQADAAIQQAQAQLNQRKAEVVQAKAGRSEKQALLKLKQRAYERLEKLVKEGAIESDDLLEAEFDRDAAKSARESVEAGVQTAIAGVEAAQAHLVKADADKKSAQAEVAVAEADLARVQTMVDYGIIKAPFDGVITRRHVDHGAFVQPATSNSGAMPLFEITRVDKIRVVVSVPTVAAAKIAEGQKVRFHTIGGLPGAEVDGTVTRSAAILYADSRMMRIDIHFENPASDRNSGNNVFLKPGMFGTITIISQEWSEQAPLAVVPTSAVAGSKAGRPYVVVVENGDRCRLQPVETAFNDAIDVGISKGVNVGDVVIVGDVSKLQDGQEIKTLSD